MSAVGLFGPAYLYFLGSFGNYHSGLRNGIKIFLAKMTTNEISSSKRLARVKKIKRSIPFLCTGHDNHKAGKVTPTMSYCGSALRYFSS